MADTNGSVKIASHISLCQRRTAFAPEIQWFGATAGGGMEGGKKEAASDVMNWGMCQTAVGRKVGRTAQPKYWGFFCGKFTRGARTHQSRRELLAQPAWKHQAANRNYRGGAMRVWLRPPKNVKVLTVANSVNMSVKSEVNKQASRIYCDKNQNRMCLWFGTEIDFNWCHLVEIIAFQNDNSNDNDNNNWKQLIFRAVFPLFLTTAFSASLLLCLDDIFSQGSRL